MKSQLIRIFILNAIVIAGSITLFRSLNKSIQEERTENNISAVSSEYYIKSVVERTNNKAVVPQSDSIQIRLN